MIRVITYGDTINSKMEEEDTKYVIDELKKSQESLQNLNRYKVGVVFTWIKFHTNEFQPTPPSSFSEGAYCKATKLIRLIRKSACRTVSGGEGREGRRGGGGVGKEGHKRRFHDADTSIFIRRFERNARFTVLSSTGIIRNAEHGRGNLWIPLPVDIYGRGVSSTSTYFSFFFSSLPSSAIYTPRWNVNIHTRVYAYFLRIAFNHGE